MVWLKKWFLRKGLGSKNTESRLPDISQSKPTNLVEINGGNEEGNALTEYLPKKKTKENAP